MTHTVVSAFSVGDIHRGWQLVSSKTIRVGDTNYHILWSNSTQTEMSNPSLNVKLCVLWSCCCETGTWQNDFQRKRTLLEFSIANFPWVEFRHEIPRTKSQAMTSGVHCSKFIFPEHMLEHWIVSSVTARECAICSFFIPLLDLLIMTDTNFSQLLSGIFNKWSNLCMYIYIAGQCKSILLQKTHTQDPQSDLLDESSAHYWVPYTIYTVGVRLVHHSSDKKYLPIKYESSS